MGGQRKLAPTRRILSTILAICVGCLLCACSAETRGTEAAAHQSHRVAFHAVDGALLRGRLFGKVSGVAFVFSHMGNRDNTEADWRRIATALARHGRFALTYNRRGVCDPNGTTCSGGAGSYADAWKDVVGAYRFVMKAGAKRVVLVGASVGAMASLRAAARADVRVAGLIEIAGVNHLSGYDFARHEISSIEGRKLFISSKGDPWGGADAAREWYRWASAPKQLVLLPGSAHGTDMLAEDARSAKRLTILIETFGDKSIN